MDKKEIWVIISDVVECESVYQLLNKAFELSKSLDAKVTTACIGQFDDKIIQELSLYGSQKIIHSEYKGEFDISIYSDLLEEMLNEYHPMVVLFPASDNLRPVAAVLATRFNTGLTADCFDIYYDEKYGFIFRRSALSSTIDAQIVCKNENIQMCTVKENVFTKCEYNLHETVYIKYNSKKDMEFYQNSNVEIVEKIPAKPKQKLDFNNVNIVFGVGRGIKNMETLEKIKRLAEKYHAVIVGTRAVVEMGFLEEERQIGQSGINISPNCYVAFGISGASQHIVGIKNAKKIIAINNDKDAPIFHNADYGIISDMNTILDQLVTE